MNLIDTVQGNYTKLYTIIGSSDVICVHVYCLPTMTNGVASSKLLSCPISCIINQVETEWKP